MNLKNKKYTVKLEITNDRNNEKITERHFFDTIEEKESFICEKRKEEDDWNYRTKGAFSFKSYFFSE